MTAATVVTAAGRGVRLGSTAPKALVLLDGEPLVVHAVRAMLASSRVSHVVVTAPADEVDAMTALLRGLGDVTVVAGGATRQESVLRGVRAVDARHDIVLVHDAARPLVPVDVVDSVLDAVLAGAPAVVPVLPVADTVRSSDGERLGPVVDRRGLRTVQTPQGFARAVLLEAHEAFAADGAQEATAATDDASLVERWGAAVVAVDGSQEAFKVTRPFDLLVAQAVLRDRAAVAPDEDDA